MAATSGDPQPPSNGPDVRIITWRPTGTTESTDVGALKAIYEEPDSRVWVDCIDPSPELVRPIAESLGLHPLIAEDIAERNQRAKIETFDDVVHIVLFALRYVGEVETSEIDEVQDAAIAKPIPETLEAVFRLKRELIRIRHVVGPSREVFAQLTSREFGQITEANVFYFRDVYDHLIRLNDELDSFRELVAGSLEIYLSTINNNLSTIMKRLTGVTVILAGIGAIGGVFGMSEAASAINGTEGSGFYVILLATVAGAMVGVWFLRRIDWL